jgi:hypothetical protein
VASRGRYTRSNPDPNPPSPVENPNIISRGRQRFSDIPGTSNISKSLFPEFLRSPENKIVDDKIQEVLLRSEEEEELIGIILSLQKKGIDTSSLVSQTDKEEFWEIVTSELLLEEEDLEKLKELDPFEVLFKSKTGLPLPDWSSFVSGLQSPNSPFRTHTLSSASVSPNSPQTTSQSTSALSGHTVPIVTVPPFQMAVPARYAPLALPQILHDLPSKYAARIPTWGGDEDVTAEEHVDRFNDFVDREEVDDEDVKLRLFAQTFIGEVRKWFKALGAGSIHSWAEFEDSFLRKWGNRTNPVQALTEYNNLRRAPEETIQNFSKRFNKIYNSIPAHLKPPGALAQLRYAESFDSDFSLLLRERESVQ